MDKLSGRPTGSKPLSEAEKNVIIEIINEYAPLKVQDKQIREIAMRRLGHNIHQDI